MITRVGPIVAALAALALVPGAASAATVSVAGFGYVQVVDNTSEKNNLRITGANMPGTGRSITVDERGTASLTAGAGCALGLDGNVVCVPPGQLRIDLFLRFGDDVVTNDMTATTAEVPRLNAELGGDDDIFTSALSQGSTDVVDGEFGNDTLRGGDGNDALFGDQHNDRIEGGAGNDVIRGGFAADRIDGDAGNDKLNGDGGDDVIGPLLDTPRLVCVQTTFGGRVCTLRHFVDNPPPDGVDTVHGDVGSDIRIAGDFGNDILSTVDGQADERSACGDGNDTLEIDLTDPGTLAGGTSGVCETVTRGARDQHPLTRLFGGTLRVSRTGKVALRVACPRARRCRGRVRLRARGRTLASRRYRIRARRGTRVKLQLSPGARRLASRRKGLRATAVAGERDSQGRALTSTTRVTLRRR